MADNAAAAPANDASIDSNESVIPFALTPAIAHNEPVNLPDQWGIMIYQDAVTPLSRMSKYNLDASHLPILLFTLAQKVTEQGWENIIDIPKVANLGKEFLIKHYGTIKLNHIRIHTNEYVATPMQQAQSSYWLFLCLWASMSDKALNPLHSFEEEYTIKVAFERFSSGACFLKIIIR
jgi:hypothetical protein